MTLNQFHGAHQTALSAVPDRPGRRPMRPRSSTRSSWRWTPVAEEVTFYEEDGTQHFLEAMLIAEVIVPNSPEPSQTR